MSLKTKIYLVVLVLVLVPVVIVPIHRAHQYYHQSYADVLYNLVINHRFGPHSACARKRAR
jgi:hypothetical protein